MIRTINLKTAIYNLIHSAVPNTHEQGHVDEDAEFPYAVYALGNSLEGEVDNAESIRYPLEIDVYDSSIEKDTTALENLADAVDEALNRQHYIGEDFYFMCIRESRKPNYPVPDEYTFRRNLRYLLKVYKRSGQ